MLALQTMDELLKNQLFRAVLTARANGIPSDTSEQYAAASRASEQIERVRPLAKGSPAYLLAVGTLWQRLNAYLVAYDETEPPYLPAALRDQQ